MGSREMTDQKYTLNEALAIFFEERELLLQIARAIKSADTNYELPSKGHSYWILLQTGAAIKRLEDLGSL